MTRLIWHGRMVQQVGLQVIPVSWFTIDMIYGVWIHREKCRLFV